jgi:hypothetical protein
MPLRVIVASVFKGPRVERARISAISVAVGVGIVPRGDLGRGAAAFEGLTL